MTLCKDCGMEIEWRRLRSGKARCYEVVTANGERRVTRTVHVCVRHMEKIARAMALGAKNYSLINPDGSRTDLPKWSRKPGAE